MQVEKGERSALFYLENDLNITDFVLAVEMPCES